MGRLGPGGRGLAASMSRVTEAMRGPQLPVRVLPDRARRQVVSDAQSARTHEETSMPNHGDALTFAFDSRDLGRLVDLMDERVIWRGIVDDGHEDEHDHEGEPDDHEHGPPMCT